MALDLLLINPGNKSKVYQSLSTDFVAIETPSFTLLIAEYIRRLGYSVDIIDIPAGTEDEAQVAQRVHNINPKLVGVFVYGYQPSASTQNMYSAGMLCKSIKLLNPQLKIMISGTHPAALPERTLCEEAVDYVCDRDGFSTTEFLLKHLNGEVPISEVSSLWYWDNGLLPQIKHNPPSILMKDAELSAKVPTPAWDLIDLTKYRSCNWHSFGHVKERSPYASIYTSLGCPFSCSFCLDENTNIIVSNGKNKKIKDITKEDKLVAFDTENNNVVETNIVEIASRKVNEIYKITLTDGKEILATDEHPFYIEGKWIEAKDLKVGDKVLVIDFHDKIALNKKLYNPAHSDEVKSKISNSVKKLYQNGKKSRFFEKDFQKNHRCKDKEKLKRMSAAISKRMTENNPMHSLETREKVSNTQKSKIESGEIVPFFMTNKGREIISKIATDRANSDNNPMKNLTPEQLEKLSVQRTALANRLWNDPEYRDVQSKSKNCFLAQGEDRVQWKGGISYEEYGPEFNKELKKLVKERDNYTCQMCGKTNCKLQVHHIDYNKKNSHQCNLISLCWNCHPKTNFNREFYHQLFASAMELIGNCPHNVSISSIEKIEGERQVYNFQCAPYDNYFAEYILTHNCCINAPFGKPSYRLWHPDVIIEQLDELVNKYGVKNVKFVDEMFVLNESHVMGICDRIIERKLDLNIWAYARVDTVKDKFLERLKQAGFNWLALGIESSSKHVRDGANKVYTNDDITDVVRKIQSHGIYVMGNYIFGLPDDTHESMQNTLDMAIELNTEFANFYSAMCYPGSELYKLAIQNNWDVPPSWLAYSQHSYETFPMRTDHLTNAEVLKFRDNAFDTYFGGKRYQDMVMEKFGINEVEDVRAMLSFKLKRKILGD